MATSFELEILTPEKSIYRGEGYHLLAPGKLGYLGILPNHAPLFTSLEPGMIVITPPGGGDDVLYVVSGGFLEVSLNKVTVLADAAELPEDIDLERAKIALKRARDYLHKADAGVDLVQAQAAMKRARMRIRAAENAGNHR